MAYLSRGQASSATSPVLDVYTSFNSTMTDVYSLKFKIFDISTDVKRAEYYSGNPDLVQAFPTTPGQYFTCDVVNLTTDAVPGHKLSTGHYYAPFTAPTTAEFGNYVIAWSYKRLFDTPEKVFQEEFVIINDGTVSTGIPLVEKLKLYMQDFFHKNELLDKLEYTQQQYEFALELSMMRFNTHTVLTDYKVDNFPSQAVYLLFLGGAGHLLRSTSIEQLRNQLTYTDGNIHVGLTDKHQLYVAIGNQHLQEFDQITRGVKNQLNNDSAWGEVFSPLMPFFGNSGDGTGWGSI